MKKERLLLLGGLSQSLVNFRGPLIQEAVRRGFEVVAVANEPDERVYTTLKSWGATFVPLKLSRTGMNPWNDLLTIKRLITLLKTVKPDVFIGYALKPVTYGLLAARIAGIPHRYAMITGLGYAFTEGSEAKRTLARIVSSAAYKIGLRFADGVVFQNQEDLAEFRERDFISNSQRTLRVQGTGVDLTFFRQTPLPNGHTKFLMIARLLKDKGIYEYVEAARIAKRSNPELTFILAGPLDLNPTSIKKMEVDKWVREGSIDYRGPLDDVRPLINECHVYVLPSYREGMPRTVQEAMAMGRPVITTDSVGCRDTVTPHKNGLLVPPASAKELSRAMEYLDVNRHLLKDMGNASAIHARTVFDANMIASEVMNFIQEP